MINVTPTLTTIDNAVQDPTTEEVFARGLAWLHANMELFIEDMVLDLGGGGTSCRELLNKHAVDWGLAHPRDDKRRFVHS